MKLHMATYEGFNTRKKHPVLIAGAHNCHASANGAADTPGDSPCRNLLIQRQRESHTAIYETPSPYLKIASSANQVRRANAPIVSAAIRNHLTRTKVSTFPCGSFSLISTAPC